MTADERLDPGIQRLIAAVDGRPDAMVALALTLLLPRGLAQTARRLCDAALALAPDDREIAAQARRIRSAGVGKWYFTMVQDDDRHALYAAALRSVMPADATLLDIGAGTGLFAMIAARAGAARVIACERDPAVAAAASAVVARNGYADHVTIVPKDARDLQIGVDLVAPANVLLWDNLANNLIGAGGLKTVEDARARLLTRDAVIMPYRAEIMVGLATHRRPADYAMGIVDGFDMTPFNRLAVAHDTPDRGAIDLRSNGVAIFDMDFTGPPIPAARNAVTVHATAGRVHGIVQWIRFHLTEGIVYDTIDPGVRAFETEVTPVEPFDVTDGQAVVICGRHDRDVPWFWLEA